jgi:hypothetical protein
MQFAALDLEGDVIDRGVGREDFRNATQFENQFLRLSPRGKIFVEQMVTHHLAQINIGRLVAPLQDPRVAGFVRQLDAVNALAEASAGFVWRLKSEGGNATDIAWSDDPLVIVNMSVWESVESLRAFVYAPGHLEVLRRRGEWFEKPGEAHACLWWVPVGHRPTLEEARERLAHFRLQGGTEYAFWFSKLFPAP